MESENHKKDTPRDASQNASKDASKDAIKNYAHNLRVYISFGILFELMNTLFNPFAMKYLERIGGTDFDISLFNGLKGLVMVFAVLPGVFLLDRLNDKKRITGQMVLVGVFFVLSLVIVPFLPQSMQPFVFILLMTFMTVPNALFNVSYQDLTGDLFPQNRAWVLSKRAMYTIVFTNILTLLTGLVFRWWGKDSETIIFIYQVFYIMAFVLGIGAYLVFRTFDYTPREHVKPLSFKGSFKRVFSHKPFKEFVIASTVFHFGWQMGWPLFNIYMIKNLGADELWLSLISIGSAITMFFGHRYWPSAIKKYGPERITTICVAGMAVTPILYVLSPNLLILSIISSTSGFFTAGTITVLFTDMLEVTPEENRIVYVGYYNTLTNITLAISPFVGLFFLQQFDIFVALIVTAAMRFVGVIAFYIREKRWHTMH